MGKKHAKKKVKPLYLSMVLDTQDDALVDEYASLRKASRATAIRQFLHDFLPQHIRQLEESQRLIA